MKKTILAAALAFMAIGSTVAQIKEGTITYEVNVDGLPPEQAAMLSGMELKMFFKTGKSRAEMSSAFFNSTTINDGKKTTVLMDQMGQKFYYEFTEEDMKKQDAKGNDPVIEYKDETKKIAGYDCKKALIKNKDEKGEESVSTVWYTEQIPYTNQGSGRGGKSMFKGLKGAPLEFEMAQGPVKMKFTATEVSKAAVADSKFVANTEGYVKKTPEDMKKMAGGKGN
jgi:GLPGLI family protein